MEDLQMLNASSKPDLMSFTEVIPTVQVNLILDAQLKIKGYELYTNFDNLESNLGASGIRGTAIYVQENIKSKEVGLQSQFDDLNWVEIGLQNDDSLLCGCIYRSPTKEKQSTIESTIKICKVIAEATQRNNAHLIICVDFNYPCIDWEHEFVEEHTDVIKPFIEIIQSYYLHPPTRIRTNKIQRRTRTKRAGPCVQ